jgi:hypothetical protein
MIYIHYRIIEKYTFLRDITDFRTPVPGIDLSQGGLIDDQFAAGRFQKPQYDIHEGRLACAR